MTNATLAERRARLIEQARAIFGRHPTFFVRAPGRVNLLGEHTDYNMLPVLPMAIERCVWIAGAPRDDRTVNLRSAGSFPERGFDLAPSIPKFAGGDWGNYAKAAAQGLSDYYGHPLRRGADLLVEGDIPFGAGLSSSSALVVASALALLAANEEEIPFEILAEILPMAERYVGTLSGGMDQTVSLLAKAGNALRIDFAPLRCRPVPLPPGHAIVVCHSLVQAEKSGAAKRAYNQRVIECRLACYLLGKIFTSLHAQPASLGELAACFPDRLPSSFVANLMAFAPDAPLTLERIAALAGVSPADLRQDCEVPVAEAGPFTIVARARHVFTEAERVDRAEQALRSGKARDLGDLMNASHESCRDDYEISCAELEMLVAIARDAGALGARLTGAGFGGCTVNLVAGDRVGSFIENVDEKFYRRRTHDGQDIENLRFVFTPQAGAGIERL